MSYSVARPGTALSTGSITGSLISSSSGDSAKFFIKCTSATFNATVPVVETTGSGDATVRYDHGDKPYYDITLQGVMLGDKGCSVGKPDATGSSCNRNRRCTIQRQVEL
jgi:hypothetical protein